MTVTTRIWVNSIIPIPIPGGADAIFAKCSTPGPSQVARRGFRAFTLAAAFSGTSGLDNLERTCQW